ncbi:MAG: hypothetical protein FJ147_06865 [Deltaproteobacteria bacterium]|nr:hypothetical protein [Deltaproteobacteria bacterium]
MEEDKRGRDLAQAVTIPEISLRLQYVREAKGLSLREAEAATRVPVHYLRLLEGRGDSRLLSDILDLVPFLRTYALFLGLDPEETIAQFVQSVHTKEDALSELSAPPSTPQSTVRPMLLLISLASVVLIAVLWLIRKS